MFYGVAGGTRSGVYTTWPDAQKASVGVAGARCKKFRTREEACAFAGIASAPAAPRAAAGAPAGERGLAGNEIAIFTDGACEGNVNVASRACPAGWGAIVVEGCVGNPPRGGAASTRLYGPVELDPSSPGFLGAEFGSNNTGELSAVCEALRWLLEHERTGRAAVICYDSEYAANQAQGFHKAHKNVALSQKSRDLLRRARGAGRQVGFLHVKGHSGHRWNDAADALANRGAAGERSASGGEPVAPAGATTSRGEPVAAAAPAAAEPTQPGHHAPGAGPTPVAARPGKRGREEPQSGRCCPVCAKPMASKAKLDGGAACSSGAGAGTGGGTGGGASGAPPAAVSGGTPSELCDICADLLACA